MQTTPRESLRSRWSRSASTEDERAQARRHAAALQEALHNGCLTDAHQHFRDMHRLAQNSFRIHCQSHWLQARVYQRERRWKAAALQAYLGLMAPYGTLRRRVDGCRLGEPGPAPLLAVFRQWAPQRSGILGRSRSRS